MLVAAFGLPGSASTLVYNIAKSMLRESGGDGLIYGVFDNLDSFTSLDLAGGRDMLVRSHSPRHFMFDLLRISGAKCIVTTRNIMECAASLRTRILPNEVDCTKNIVRSFAAIQTALCYFPNLEIRYNRHNGDTLSIIEALEDYLEINLRVNVKKNLAHEHSAEQIKNMLCDKRRMSQQGRGEFCFDPETQYNENHFSPTKKPFSNTMNRELSSLFSAFDREDISLGIGDEMVLSREIFAPDGPASNGDGPGLMVLRSAYLPRGLWALRIAGRVEGARISRVVLCQSGQIVSEATQHPNEVIDTELEVANLRYDDDFQVFLGVEGDAGALRWTQDLTFAARLLRFV